MTDARRVAMTEAINLIALLVDATTPHAEELAAVVATRLVGLADGCELEPLPESEIEEWTRLARELTDRPRAGLRLVN